MRLRYKYRVRDASGLTQTGILEADHQRTIILGLLDRGYTIIDLLELDPRIDERRRLQFPVRVDSQSLASFTRQLAVMLAAGLPILHCLQTLQSQTGNHQLKLILTKVVSEVRAGRGLAEAFSKHPRDISGIYVNMIKAGETSGTLDTVLLQLSIHLQKQETSSRRLRAAAVYPVFTTLLAMIIVLLLLTLVIPRFAEIFEAAGICLPWSTQILLEAGRKLQSRGPCLLVLTVAASGLLWRAARSRSGKPYIDSLRLRMPVIGPLERRRIEATFTSTLAILLKAGIPILAALEVVADTISNQQAREAVRAAIRSTGAGDTLAGSLARSGIFAPMLTDMIAVGETTGNLDNVFGQLSEYCGEELSDSLENLAKMVEPTLIVMVAGIVGAVVVAMLLPMMDMVSTVGLCDGPASLGGDGFACIVLGS